MKNILLLSLLTLFLSVANAQVHIKNQHYVQVNVGGYDKLIHPDLDNFFIQAEYGKYGKKLNARGFAFLYAKKLSTNHIPVEKYQVSFKQEINLFSSADLRSTFKILGSVDLGYESINRDQEYSGSNYVSAKSAFIMGLGTGAEYEFSPIVVGTRVTYNFLSNYQKFTTYPYIGIKFHLK
ncbi:conjugal transfer protein TraO [Dyadobacter alkalitolerans]|uniref:conjugal transfer protein TraO n=1 Tax=Dyadobacter alkalitolerans TaxID=492736 RepID=UPI00047C730A|nr:conjugal transfer protein TraO [Dyadobacter alkalitolerans]